MWGLFIALKISPCIISLHPEYKVSLRLPLSPSSKSPSFLAWIIAKIILVISLRVLSVLTIKQPEWSLYNVSQILFSCSNSNYLIQNNNLNLMTHKARLHILHPLSHPQKIQVQDQVNSYIRAFILLLSLPGISPPQTFMVCSFTFFSFLISQLISKNFS